jgi:hypothetical protein
MFLDIWTSAFAGRWKTVLWARLNVARSLQVADTCKPAATVKSSPDLVQRLISKE